MGIMPRETPLHHFHRQIRLRQKIKFLTAFVVALSCTELSPSVSSQQGRDGQPLPCPELFNRTVPAPTCGPLPVFRISIPVPPRTGPAISRPTPEDLPKLVMDFAIRVTSLVGSKPTG